jgi:hypothetical protein
MIVSIQQSTFPLDPQFVGALYQDRKKDDTFGDSTHPKNMYYIS